MAMPIMRQLLRKAQRHPLQVAQGFRRLAFGQGFAVGAGNGCAHVSRQDDGLLGPLADHPRLRRDPPCRLRGRHLADERMHHPHRMHGGPCNRLPSRPERELQGLGMPHGTHRSARHPRLRRRRRHREGQARRMAEHSCPKMHLPCLLPGQKMHHHQAKDAGWSRPLCHCEGPHAHREQPGSGRVDGGFRRWRSGYGGF